jgi:hypothetical protein
VVGEVAPVRLAEGEAFLSAQPDLTRSPIAEDDAVVGRLAAACGSLILHWLIVLDEDHRIFVDGLEADGEVHTSP